jgi:hypothetical protein
MKVVHILLLAVLTFCWIWLLPLMCIGFFFSVPVVVVSLPICIVISLTLQWWQHGQIYVDHPIRNAMSTIPWYQWFPCNQLDVPETSVVAVHPHGLLCCGALVGIHFVPGSKTVFCVAPLLFYIPVLGWFLRILGCVPAHYAIMLECLRAGHSVLIVPGGVPELVMAERSNDEMWFKRSGFIRLANEARVPIQMVFVRGECSTYRMLQGPLYEPRVHWAWKTNVPFVVPIFCGWYGSWLPRRVPLQMVMSTVQTETKNDYYNELRRLVNV